MATPEEIKRARRLRKRHKHERQALIFGVLIAGMAVAGLGAAAVYSGTVDAPFDRPFSSAKQTDEKTFAIPCLPEGTLPVAYSSVGVNVYNATTRVGLAKSVATSLTERGFVATTAGDAAAKLVNVQISFGKEGLAAAYTVAAQFIDPTLVYDNRADGSVDIALGSSFEVLVDKDSTGLVPEQAMISREGCVAIDTITPAVRPTPKATEGTDTTEDEVPEGDGEGVPVG